MLGLLVVATAPLWSWPLRHAGLLRDAWAYRRAPTTMAVPVAGLAPSGLVSTWHAPRSGGRRHEGADLFARRGTPVVSCVDGSVWRVGHDALGGQVVWVLGEGRTLYYYAHLDAFADGLHVGQRVRRGAVLGHVGNTGNARTTPPHLHFGMYRVGWRGLSAVDPVPRLKRLAAAGRSAETGAAHGDGDVLVGQSVLTPGEPPGAVRRPGGVQVPAAPSAAGAPAQHASLRRARARHA